MTVSALAVIARSERGYQAACIFPLMQHFGSLRWTQVQSLKLKLRVPPTRRELMNNPIIHNHRQRLVRQYSDNLEWLGMLAGNTVGFTRWSSQDISH